MGAFPSFEADELLQKLGAVVGVSELAISARQSKINAPVLIAENAFVFFAWHEDEFAL
ncbi:MAG TPA: hypothetical protein V6C76_13095 [Drouetiella sp.]